MKEIKAREVRASEVELGLEIRNSIFSPITVEEWEKGDPATGSIAFSGEETVGFIPLTLRDIKIAPEVRITAAYENAVGTKESYRGHGIGSKMIDAAKDFITEKADALFVIRGAERSRGYNFYSKTNHIDLHYVRKFSSEILFKREHPNVSVSKIFAEDKKQLDLESQMISLFQDSYSNIYGYRERKKGFWKKAFNATYFAAHPTDFTIFKLIEADELTGYIITGLQRDAKNKDQLPILEMAARNADPVKIKILLEAAANYAFEKEKKGLKVLCGDSNPFLPVLKTLGFTASLRRRQTMAIIPEPKTFFNKFWRDNFNLPEGIELRVWTPERDFTLIESANTEEKTNVITLEMKDRTLTRWLLGRIDLKSRIKENTVTINNANDQLIDQIVKGIPYYDWEYFHIDYI
jgi:GNAT superfamily N-acetyltransferase